MVVNRAAELRAVRDDLVRRIQARGIAVLQQSWTLYDGTCGAYEPPNKLLWYAGDQPLEAQIAVLLHETAHIVRGVSDGFYNAHQRSEELLVEGAASIALFQLVGYCDYAMRASNVYRYRWQREIYPPSPVPRGAKPRDTDDEDDALAGQVLEFLGLTEEVPA